MTTKEKYTEISKLITDYRNLAQTDEISIAEYSIALIESLINKISAENLSPALKEDKKNFLLVTEKLISEEKWVTSAIIDGIVLHSEKNTEIVKPAPSYVIASGLGFASIDFERYKDLITATGVTLLHK